MGISYFDSTARSLKAAIYTCFEGSCAWDKITVSAPDSPDFSEGLYSSFKFNSTGNASIAFFHYNSVHLDSILEYAYQVLSGGDCGEGPAAGLWECDEVNLLGGEGKYASLDFSYDDVEYISYYSANEGDLILAVHGGMCGPELGWSCFFLDGADANVGLFASLIASQSSVDPFRIAYYDKTNGHLKIFDSDWGEPIVVDEMGTSLEPMGISMVIDNEGYPVIAYQQIASDFSTPDLRISRPYVVYGTDPYGNCGDSPPGYLFQYWQCKTIDYGGQYSEEADFAAMAINSKGLVGIAYSEYDTDYYVRSLKFTYQHLFRTFLPITNRQ